MATRKSTFSTIGSNVPGGNSGYKKAARQTIKKEIAAKENKSGKKMTYNEKSAYQKKRTGPLEQQMYSDRTRSASRAKTKAIKAIKAKNPKSTVTRNSAQIRSYGKGKMG